MTNTFSIFRTLVPFFGLASAIAGQGAIPSQIDAECTNQFDVATKFLSSNGFYNSEIADDVVIPATSTAHIAEVVVQGSYSAQDGSGPYAGSGAYSFNVIIYADASNSPGASGCSYTNLGVIETNAPGSIPPSFTTTTIPLSSPCLLTGGSSGTRYWVSVQANIENSLDRQWNWQDRNTQTGDPSEIRFPNGGECTSWGAKNSCQFLSGLPPDQCFAVLDDEIFVGQFE